MTGYGLTVFAGTRHRHLQRHACVGVQPNVRAQGSVMLVEVGGHGLEQSSIAQGMSGSPVFLEGRFAGALAFGWEGALRPHRRRDAGRRDAGAARRAGRRGDAACGGPAAALGSPRPAVPAAATDRSA